MWCIKYLLCILKWHFRCVFLPALTNTSIKLPRDHKLMWIIVHCVVCCMIGIQVTCLMSHIDVWFILFYVHNDVLNCTSIWSTTLLCLLIVDVLKHWYILLIRDYFIGRAFDMYIFYFDPVTNCETFNTDFGVLRW